MKMHSPARPGAAILGVLVVLLAAVPAAGATDLVDVYNMAAESDPEFRRVAASKRAILEQRPQALAQLLPDINLSANTISNDQSRTTTFPDVDGEGFGAVESIAVRA